MVADGAFSHKIDYVTIFQEIQNPEGNPNRITGSKVMAIFAEWVDFTYWWSFIRKGLRLQPAQQACLSPFLDMFVCLRISFISFGPSLLYISKSDRSTG